MSVTRRLSRPKPATPAPRSDDRRSVCRYAVTHPRAWLGWWDSEQFHSTPAEVVDISLRGCRMTVEQLPTAQDSVWFCPSHPTLSSGATAVLTPSDWIEAKVIESRKRLFGPRVVRIVFRRSFPYEVFKSVVYGPARVGGLRSPLWIPEVNLTDDRDWW